MKMVRPTIHGKNVVLRPLLPADIEDYLPLIHDPEVARFTGSSATFSRVQIEQWLAKIQGAEDRLDLAIMHAKSGEFAGEVVINEIDWQRQWANMRIALLASHVNLGLGSEVLSLIIDWIFEHTAIEVIGLEVLDFNQRARHVYRKLGFVESSELLPVDEGGLQYITMSLKKAERKAMH